LGHGLEPPEARRSSAPLITIPQQVQETLITITEARHGALADIPVVEGINEVVFYLDRATNWHARQRLGESSRGCKVANAIRAYWLLGQIQQADEYKRSEQDLSPDHFRQQLTSYGMTLSHFVSQLEDVWH